MDAITQVKELVTQMDETQRRGCLELFTKTETEDETLKKSIGTDIEKLKAGFAELSTDNWEAFCTRLERLSDGMQMTFRMIGRREEIEREAKTIQRKEYAQGMVNQGFKFDRITIEGQTFRFIGGELHGEVTEDDIPF